jgi:integrase
MARAINRLTNVAVKNATKPGMYADGAGLYLRVGPTGGKGWIFRYKRGGRLHDIGLGPVYTVSLASARQRAQKCREQRLDGVDPLTAKKEAKIAAKLEAAKAMTFRACAAAYISAHQDSWRHPKHRTQWSSSIATYVLPVIGELPVQSVDVGFVMKVIEPIWLKKPETASRVRGRIERILDWATARGYRQGENPARWRGHLEALLPPPAKAKRAARQQQGRKEHHAALPYGDLPGFMAVLRQQVGVGGMALEFTILTAARTGEVIGARWNEIDQANRLWTIPGERMKAGKEHRVPLSDAAMAIVETMAASRRGDLVFPGRAAGKSLSDATLARVLEGLGRDDLTVHGFRSTFSDWCAEKTNFGPEVREMALAHAVGDKVEAAYRRGDLFDKRRQLAAAWASFCDGATGAEDVRPIRAVG